MLFLWLISLYAAALSYDVNVTPDKRTILLHREAAIIQALTSRVQTALPPSLPFSLRTHIVSPLVPCPIPPLLPPFLVSFGFLF